jgi:hypothetical protein
MVPPASRTIGESASDNDPQLRWTHGFSDTSLQDLEPATGVNKSGLYTEFRDMDMTLCSLSKGPSQQMFPVELTRARIAHFSCEFPLCVRSHVFAERRGLRAHGPYSRFHLGTRLPREQASCGRHPWLWFDEHLWLACRICEAWLRWYASVLSSIVSRRVERGTQGRECNELCAITPQTEARNKTQ